MQVLKISGLILLCVSILTVSGCIQEKDLKIQNATQRERLATLESEAQATRLKIDQLDRKLQSADDVRKAETDALEQTIAAAEEDIVKKKALIASMQKRILTGSGVLPIELSTMLEDFASKEDLVSYDPNSGVVKFKSDLAFESGRDIVTPVAKRSIELLCNILNTEQGKKFDIIIAGHTDDLRIGKPATKEKHPSNWHLSAHRAISVLRVLEENKVGSDRLSVHGFGEYRPVAPNKPNKKGNPQNRRVEIYIVAKGV